MIPVAKDWNPKQRALKSFLSKMDTGNAMDLKEALAFSTAINMIELSKKV